MQTDTQKYNETVTPNSKEIEILKKYFPQCFSKPETDKNGTVIKEHFDTEKLAELLNKDEVDIKKEGFTLNFLGKSYARYQANLDSETVIVPDEQNAETNSENVYIVGDNLDALQHLKYSYAEKIKCVYIDPPYNTGKDDFVYNDKFGFTAKELVEKLDVTEDEADRICGMNGKCTHSAWLTFMYPRLSLARELLRDDGVIFISIDDNEQANLKRLCDEVFGEGNFVAEFIWKCRNSLQHDECLVSKQTERILFYSKDKSIWNYEKGYKLNRIRKPFDATEYTNPDNDPRGPWLSSGKTRNDGRPSYTVVSPTGVSFTKPWIPSPSEFQKWEEERLIWWGKDGTSIPRKKSFLRDFKGNAISDILFDEYTDEIIDRNNLKRTKRWEIGTTESGTKGEKILFDGIVPFDYPKPWSLIKYLASISTSCSEPDIILDFFSGSATTAHAVMQLNAQDGGKRKFIMVQLDECVKKGSEAEKAGYKTIDEIGRARIRRAAEKIKAENPETKADLDFQTFYLKSKPKNTLDKIKTFNPNSLFTSDGDIVKMLGETTLLQTWQIKDGFGFNCNRKKIDIAGCTAYLLEDEKIGKYLYLLTGMEEKSVKELIRKIESFELNVDKIFVYGYSFDFDALNSLSTNLKMLKNRNPLEPIIRY